MVKFYINLILQLGGIPTQNGQVRGLYEKELEQVNQEAESKYKQIKTQLDIEFEENRKIELARYYEKLDGKSGNSDEWGFQELLTFGQRRMQFVLGEAIGYGSEFESESLNQRNKENQTDQVLNKLNFLNQTRIQNDQDMLVFDRLLGSGYTLSERFYKEVKLQEIEEQTNLVIDNQLLNFVQTENLYCHQLKQLLKQHQVQQVPVDQQPSCDSYHKMTPLMWFVDTSYRKIQPRNHESEKVVPKLQKQFLDLVKNFLDQGASLSRRDDSGWTVLHYQLNEEEGDNAELVKILVENGQKVDQPTESNILQWGFLSSGHTPLTQCIATGKVHAAKVLLENGAQLNLPQDLESRIFSYFKYSPHSVNEYFGKSLTQKRQCSFPVCQTLDKELVVLKNPYSKPQNIYGCFTALELAYFIPRFWNHLRQKYGRRICMLQIRKKEYAQNKKYGRRSMLHGWSQKYQENYLKMILLIKSEIRKREKIEGLYRAKLTQLGLPRDDQDFLQLYY